MKYKKNITVVGLGYIGLPTACLIADIGYSVAGFDINHAVIEAVNLGKTHIEEPGLADLLERNIAAGRLVATNKIQPADVFILSVPTPLEFDQASNEPRPNISYVETAIRAISCVLKAGNLIIIESTCPVGTTRKMYDLICDLRKETFADGQAGIHICYCPERVIPGKILNELVGNDRIIGGICGKSTEEAIAFYKTFVEGECLPADNAEQAELVKLVENSFRDVNIAFANQVGLICEGKSIDAWKTIELANKHPRVNILSPGPGVGGHCIAVDPWFLVSMDPKNAKLTHLAREINDEKPYLVIEKVSRLAREFADKKVICCGLTYKPDVDDFRESPSLLIYKKLREEFGKRVELYDPYVEKLNDGLSNIDILYLENSDDIIVFLVPHRELLQLKPQSHHIIDVCGGWVQTDGNHV